MNRIDVDISKIIFHPKRISKWIDTGDCYPIYVEVGLTNSCNHRCVFCALDFLKAKGNYIDKKVFSAALKDMSQKGVKSIMFAGEGEPTLHKNVGYFAKIAKKNGLDVSITTNGVPFGSEKIKETLPYLSWIRFSIDSGSPENYSFIHGTSKEDFERVIKNIKECVRFRDKNRLDVTIGTQFLVIPKNFEEASKLAKILSDVGVDNLQIKPYSHHPFSFNDFIIDPRIYNELEHQVMQFDSPEFEVKFRKEAIQRTEQGINYSKCHGLSFFTLIDSKGNLIPCNLFYRNKEFVYGNLYDNSFSDIWKSKKRKKVISKINLKGISDCRICCRLDRENRYLQRIKNPLSHDNFI